LAAALAAFTAFAAAAVAVGAFAFAVAVAAGVVAVSSSFSVSVSVSATAPEPVPAPAPVPAPIVAGSAGSAVIFIRGMGLGHRGLDRRPVGDVQSDRRSDSERRDRGASQKGQPDPIYVQPWKHPSLLSQV
jgi:hypothetical protein